MRASQDQSPNGSGEPVKTTGVVGAGLLYSAVGLGQRAVTILLLPLFIRWLTPAEYGRVGVLAALSGLALYVFPLGLEAIVMRGWFIAGSTRDQRVHFASEIQRILVIFPLLLVGPFMALFFIVGVFDAVQPGFVLLTLAGGAVYVGATIVPYSVLRAERRAHSYVWLGAIYISSQIGIRLLLVGLFDLGVLGWVTADLASALLLLATAPRVASLPVMPRWPSSVAWNSLRNGLPLVPHGLGQWSLALSDRLILVHFVSLASIAVYSVGYQVGTVMLMCFTEFNRAISPDYARQSVASANSKRLSVLVSGQVGTVLALGAAAMIAAPAAIRLLLPDSYNQATDVVPWVVLGSMFVGLYQVPMNHVTLIRGDTRRIWFAAAISTVVNVLCNLLTVRRFGIQAAAVNTAVAYAVLLVLVRIYEKRTTGTGLMPEWKTLRWFLLSSAIAFAGSGAVAAAGPSKLLALTGNGAIAASLGATALLLFRSAESRATTA